MAELAKLSWPEAKREMERVRVALLPVGSTEQHGPHLPLGTDWMTAEQIARLASEKSGWLLLPTVPVGVSGHHRQFWGTLWVPPDSLRDYVIGIARAVASHGLRRLVFVNGHGGNTPALEEAARILRSENIFAFVYVWWRVISEFILQIIDTGGSHAGEMETSVVLAIASELVKTDRYEEAAAGAAKDWGRQVHGVSVGFDTIDFSQSGAVGDPAKASAEKGEKLLLAAAERLDAFAHWLAAESDEALQARPHLP